MIKNISKIEVVVGEKTYQLLCELDSPIEHVKEAIFQMGKFVGQIEDNIRKSQAALNPQSIDTAKTNPESKIDVKTEEAK